jgi:hypothetical protein
VAKRCCSGSGRWEGLAVLRVNLQGRGGVRITPQRRKGSKSYLGASSLKRCRGGDAAPVHDVSGDGKEGLVVPGVVPLLEGSVGHTHREEGSKGGSIHGDPQRGEIEHTCGGLPEVKKWWWCGHKVEAGFILYMHP